MNCGIYIAWRCPDCIAWVGSDVDESQEPQEMVCPGCSQPMERVELVELRAIAEHRDAIEAAGEIRVDDRDVEKAAAKRRADERLWKLLALRTPDVRNRRTAAESGTSL